MPDIEFLHPRNTGDRLYVGVIEPVSGVDASDFTVVGTNTASGSVTTVSPAGPSPSIQTNSTSY